VAATFPFPSDLVDTGGAMSLTVGPTTSTIARRRLRTAAAAAVVASAVALAGCAGTGYHYVKSSEDHTYFKVPDSWKLYSQQDLLDHSPLTKDEKDKQLATSWLTVFDASPKPSIAHVTGSKPAFPIGKAIVLHLSDADNDQVSLTSLRNLFFTVDDAVNANAATVLTYDPVNLDGGFHGAHLIVRYTQKNTSITLNQIAVLDQQTHKIYALAVSCTSECYDKQQSKIEKVVASWTVKDN
jgi:hypothetical protein